MEKRKVGRPKTLLGQTGTSISTKISAKLYESLTEAVDDTGLAQSTIVRAAISEWLVKYKRRAGGTKTPLEPSQTA